MAEKKKSIKIKPQELAEILHEVVERERARKIKQKQQVTSVFEKLKKVITIPLVIGFIAAFLMYQYYGWDELIRSLLSWTIGLTILATIITVLGKVNANAL